MEVRGERRPPRAFPLSIFNSLYRASAEARGLLHVRKRIRTLNGSGSVFQDLSGSFYIKGPDESMTRADSSVPLIHHDPSDLGSLILIQIKPKERTQNNILESFG